MNQETPQVSSPQEVQFYSSHLHELAKSQVEKAQKLMELGCITYDTLTRRFSCGPIIGYNKTRYWFERNGQVNGGFAFDFQGFQTKARKDLFNAWCSHLLALHFWFDQRNRMKRWGPYKS